MDDLTIDCIISILGATIARVSVAPVSLREETADFVVRFFIDKGDWIGEYQRVILDWPYKESNPIFLIKAAFDLIAEDMARVEVVDETSSSDLAR